MSALRPVGAFVAGFLLTALAGVLLGAVVGPPLGADPEALGRLIFLINLFVGTAVGVHLARRSRRKLAQRQQSTWPTPTH